MNHDSSHSLPLLGLMLGDCTGIGPEQCARVLADRRLAGIARLLVVGDARALEQGARDAGVDLTCKAVSTPEQIDDVRDAVAIIDLANSDPRTLTRVLFRPMQAASPARRWPP